MEDEADPIDADIVNADWPKRTPDTLWELQEAVRRESTPVISGEGWYIWLDIEKLEWAADVDESPIAILRDKFPRDVLDLYVAGGKTKEQLYGDAVEYLKKWGSDAKVSMLPPPKKTSPEQRSYDSFRGIEQRAARGRKKRPKMSAPRAPVKMGAFAGCGTGAGGFKPGNRCGKEDGIPNAPTYLGRKGFAKVGEKPIQVDRAKLKEQIDARRAKADAKQKARMAEDKKKSIQIKRQKAAERKTAKEAAESEAAKKATEAAAAKKAAMLQQIRRKNASKRLAVVDVKIRPDQEVYDEAVKEMVASVKRAKKSPECKGSGVGLCSYIAEDVSGRLAEKFADRTHIEVIQHLPADRDHASVVIVDHNAKTAVEVDIPESKYQRRTKTGKFIKAKNPNITERDVELKDIDYKEFERDTRPARLPGEGDLAYHMRINDKDFQAVKAGILEDHERIVVGATKAYESSRLAVDESKKATRAALDKLYSADPSAKYFLGIEPSTGLAILKPSPEAKLKPGDKDYDEAVSALRAEDAAVAAREAAHAAVVGSDAAFKQAAWARIGQLRDGKGVDVNESPRAASAKELKEYDSLRTRGGVGTIAPTNALRAPDSQVNADVAKAMDFYAAVGGGHLSKVLQSIRVFQIHSRKTPHASRVIVKDNDYDFDDVAPLSTQDPAMAAFTSVIAQAKGAPGAPAENFPYIGLKGLVKRERWQSGPGGKNVKVTRQEPAEDPKELAETAVHEIAHPIGQAKSANTLANEFWLQRWEEHGRPQLKLYSTDKDRRHQRTFDDRWFGQNYSGVVYPRISSKNSDPSSPTFVQDNAGRFRETEVLTMGAQYLFSDPKRFLEHDPEHFFFVVGVLTGRFFRK